MDSRKLARKVKYQKLYSMLSNRSCNELKQVFKHIKFVNLARLCLEEVCSQEGGGGCPVRTRGASSDVDVRTVWCKNLVFEIYGVSTRRTGVGVS